MYHPQGIKRIFHQTRRLLAKRWLSFFHPLQIGITGSQGKTSTTQTLAKILSSFGPTGVTDINLDTNFNVPITALKIRPWTKYVVWELGIDHLNEMDKHLEIARPTIGIITGISPVHSDKEHLGSLENIIKEKRKLIESLPLSGTAILNVDDESVKKMASFTQAKVFFYGNNQKEADVWCDKIKLSLNGTSFYLYYKTKNKKLQSVFLQTNLLGIHHTYTAMACFLTLKAIFNEEKKFLEKFLQVFSQLKPLSGRMSIEKGPLGTILLNDSLRANPKSTDTGLKTFYQIPYKKGRKIAVLGVMGELEKPIEEHKKTAKTILRFPPDIVIGVGEYRKYTVEEASKQGFSKNKIFYAKDVFEAAEILKKILKKDDFIYLKASLLRNFKRIIQLLNNKPICCQADLCPYEHCR